MKPYKELNKTEKTAIDITAEFWLEASKTGIEKDEWHRYNELERYRDSCGFCELNVYYVIGIFGFDCIKSNCILKAPARESSLQCGYFFNWYYAESIIERKIYATIISHLIQAYIKGKTCSGV